MAGIYRGQGNWSPLIHLWNSENIVSCSLAEDPYRSDYNQFAYLVHCGFSVNCIDTSSLVSVVPRSILWGHRYIPHWTFPMGFKARLDSPVSLPGDWETNRQSLTCKERTIPLYMYWSTLPHVERLLQISHVDVQRTSTGAGVCATVQLLEVIPVFLLLYPLQNTIRLHSQYINNINVPTKNLVCHV